jgi:ubiquinone/menaquinone biosynthesis C-methylase UbiE
MVQDRADEIWAVDESPERIGDIRKAIPNAKVVICPAHRLELPDEHFDVAVTSQMLHEVKLFGREGELSGTLSEVHRILRAGGRYLLLDHLDAGEGEMIVRLPERQLAKLAEFERKFRFRSVNHERTGEGSIRISRRSLQDFLTKDWSLDTPMETIEMNETHNVFSERETRDLVAAAGLTVSRWISFSDIREDLRRHGAMLIEGDPWDRKFLLVAEKA